MKLRNIFLLFVVAFVASSAASEKVLTCKFRAFLNYTCIATGLEIKSENVTLSKIEGVHTADKADKDVTALLVRDKVIKFLPTNFANFFPQLIRLEAKNSSLTAVTRETLKDLKDLQHLILAFNSIDNLPSDVFKDLIELEDLRLSGNRLAKLHPKLFTTNTKLEILLFDNNVISSIHENLFKDLIELKEIHLENNQIEELRESTFESNSKLKVIDVSNNKLKWIGAKLLSPMNSPSTFSFTNNECITEAYKTVDELSEIFENSCFPPYLKRFTEEIEELKNAESTLKGELEACSKNFEQEKESKAECQTELSTSEEKLKEMESEKDECSNQKGQTESELEGCKKTADAKEAEFLKISQNLTACLNQTEKDSLLLKFKENTENVTLQLCEDDQIRLKVAQETIKLAKKNAETIEQRNAEELAKKDLEVKNLQKEVAELKSQLEKLVNVEKVEIAPPKSVEKDTTDCQKDFDKLYRNKEQLQLSLTEKENELKTCMSKLPGCNSFLIDCNFQMRGSDYICMAKHISGS